MLDISIFNVINLYSNQIIQFYLSTIPHLTILFSVNLSPCCTATIYSHNYEDKKHSRNNNDWVHIISLNDGWCNWVCKMICSASCRWSFVDLASRANTFPTRNLDKYWSVFCRVCSLLDNFDRDYENKYWSVYLNVDGYVDEKNKGRRRKQIKITLTIFNRNANCI